MEQPKTNLQISFLKEEFLNIIPYIFSFFIFSFLGWIAETLFCYMSIGEFIERGFLYAPICPIYGCGTLILTLYLKKFKAEKNYIKLFIVFIIIFSFFEYITGFVMETLFSAKWWDYSNSKYNLNGRITLLNSFLWGVATIVYAKFIHPLIDLFNSKIIKKIPSLCQITIALALIIATITDLIMSCIRYLT